jgi:glycine hydroxymethyltransferase
MVSKYFEVLPYRLDINTGYYFTIGMIDYKDLESLAERYRPKLIVAGVSAYSRLIDYERISKVCKSIGSYLLADMAHVSGLMAAG